MSRLDDLKNSVGKYDCERCGFSFPIEELVEEEETGLIVDKKCLDTVGFNEKKRDGSRESISHHFNT